MLTTKRTTAPKLPFEDNIYSLKINWLGLLKINHASNENQVDVSPFSWKQKPRHLTWSLDRFHRDMIARRKASKYRISCLFIDKYTVQEIERGIDPRTRNDSVKQDVYWVIFYRSAIYRFVSDSLLKTVFNAFPYDWTLLSYYVNHLRDTVTTAKRLRFDFSS